MECSKCKKTIPEESNYCLHCGAVVEKSNQEDTDFENRVLCSDGTCTGTIVDGKCTVCGKPYNYEEEL